MSPLILLKDTFDYERLRGSYEAPIAFVDGRIYDDVCKAGLVLERQENEAFGRSGPLSRDDETADATDETVGKICESAGADGPEVVELFAKVCDRLGPGRHSRPEDVEGRYLQWRERIEHRKRFIDGRHRSAEFSARVSFVQPSERPHRIASGCKPGLERARNGKILERFFRELGAGRERIEIRKRSLGDRRLQPLPLSFA